MTFRVGQKVACVNNEPLPGMSWWYPDERPAVDAVYTVDGIAVDDVDETILFLVEIKRQGGLGYGAHRFRPVVEPKSEVSFTTGADPSSDQFDNRRKVRKKVAI